jgi:stage V sporulation protein R
MKLPTEIKHLKYEIRAHALDYGLDFFETIFEVLDYKQMNEIAAYGGFPTRYPHWRFGMEYEQLNKTYAYGLQKIYELVINNDPCYAYLLKCNKLVDQKLVIAHVYGHCDFFKNNMYFSKTNRKMVDEMANHGTRICRYADKYGWNTVEEFLDTCLSLENLIDLHSPFITRRESRECGVDEDHGEKEKNGIIRFKSKDYMDSFINPREFLEEQRIHAEDDRKKKKKVPLQPEQDVLLFLIEHAPLANWQSDVLTIIREEAYYFSPQGQTKILNEGWASYWHSKILTEKCLKDSEVIDYADHHSGTMSTGPGRINPYKIGIELLRNIEERWNRGKFGKDYEDCDDLYLKKHWDQNLGKGREKLFEVRKLYNDITFIEEFFTEDFCEEQNLFSYRYNNSTGFYEIESRDFQKIKEQLLFGLTNFGQPFIYVTEGNYRNRGELYLTHRYEGVELKIDWAKETLKNLYKIWSRPVHLETETEGKKRLLSFDGQEEKDEPL